MSYHHHNIHIDYSFHVVETLDSTLMTENVVVYID